MRLLRLSLFIGLLSATLVILLSVEVKEVDSIYAYAIKGIVKDVRLHPTRFIGGWFFKKAFILKKLKLKWKLKKKLILKKLLKKLLLGVALAKAVKGRRGGIKIIAPKIILPVLPRKFAHGWGPLNYWTHAPLHLFRRKKRAIRFPDDDANRGSNDSPQQSSSVVGHQDQQSHNYNSNRNGQHFQADEYFQNIGSLGLSQTDLDQLRRLPDNLKYEYGQEMQQLEAAASEPKEEEIQDYLSMASEFDASACIPKSICEIMSRGRNRTSNQFENQIVDYYSEPDTVEQRSSNKPAHIYDYAAYLGKTGKDGRICVSQFPNCPDTPQALNNFMNEVFTPEMCDSSAPPNNYLHNDNNHNDYQFSSH